MQERLTVLFVSHSAALYGAERSLLSLVAGLMQQNFRSVVLVPAKGPLTDALAENNVEYVVMHFKGWLSKSSIDPKCLHRAFINTMACLKLRSLLKSCTIDLVYTNTVYSPVGGVLSLVLGLPHIWHVREFVHEDLGARFDLGTAVSMKLINRASAKIICNSAAVLRKMANYVPAEKLALVYNGFPVCQRQQGVLPREGWALGKQVRLSIVGSIHEGKGQQDAINALGILLDQGLDAGLRIVGVGDRRYVSYLKSLAMRRRVAERISWESFLPDTQRVFFESDIALICSRAEAFGRVAVEAMSVGCPVVGSNAGGLPEILIDQVNGLLYEPGNHEMLASKILKLLQNSELYELVSRNAIQSVQKRFEIGRYVSEIESIIRQVLSDREHY
jgi:glycosyltransferase involved in cell wall biosynthesis